MSKSKVKVETENTYRIPRPTPEQVHKMFRQQVMFIAANQPREDENYTRLCRMNCSSVETLFEHLDLTIDDLKVLIRMIINDPCNQIDMDNLEHYFC